MVTEVTTLARVKARAFKGVTNTAADAQITAAVAAVSRQVQKYLGVSITKEDFEEKFTPMREQTIFRMFHSPLTSIATVVDRDTTLVAANYTFLNNLLYLVDYWPTYDRPLSLVVNGNGGMAADTDTFITDYPDIADVCEWWIGIKLSWDDRPAVATMSNDQGSYTRIPQSMPTEVIRVLDTHRHTTG